MLRSGGLLAVWPGRDGGQAAGGCPRGPRRRQVARRRVLAALSSLAALGLLPATPRVLGAGIRRIGFLRASPPPPRMLEAFRRGLADHGFVDGQNCVIVPSWGDGSLAKVPALAEALVKAPVDIIVADGAVPAGAAHKLTHTIPIVMAGGRDPLRDGLAQSLSRPGGNLTGFIYQVIELVGKSFQILKETIPGLTRVAVLAPVGVGSPFRHADATASQALGLSLTYVYMSGIGDTDAAMAKATAAQAQAVVVRGTPFLSNPSRRAIVEAAAAHRLPAMYETRDFVELGGLMSYGSDFDELFRRAADYVAKILNGANPATLPIQQSSKIELVLNMKTARAIGLTMPQSIVVRADEVIE